MTVGKRIRYYRKQVELTQTDLANNTEICRSLIVKYETDVNETKILQINKIAKALNINMAQLVEIYTVNKDKNNINVTTTNRKELL